MHMTPPPVVIHASSIIQAVHYDLNLDYPNVVSHFQGQAKRLRGSNLDTLAERRQEFIRAVLSGSAPPTEWAEDIEVPDTDRPWLGEALSIGTVVCLGTPE